MENREELLQLFRLPDFFEMWVVINDYYENQLAFKDEISDSERIAEYKWITQQYRKYVSKQKDVIMGHDSYDEMSAEIEDMISKASEYGDSRKELVYNILRDTWLLSTYRMIEYYKNGYDEEE